MVVARIAILVFSVLVGVVFAHADSRLRRPVLTPAVLALGAALAMSRFGQSVDPLARPSAANLRWLAVASLFCTSAYFAEGWRNYRQTVLSTPLPEDQLAEATRSILKETPSGNASTDQLLAALREGVEQRRAYERQRGSIADFARFRWANFTFVTQIISGPVGWISLLLTEGLFSVTLGTILARRCRFPAKS